MKTNLLWALFILFSLTGCQDNKSTLQNGKNRLLALEDSSALVDSSNFVLGMSVQIAAFQNRPNAENLVTQLAGSDLPAYIPNISARSEDSLYRIRVGPFLDTAAAEDALSKIRKLGFPKAYLVTDNFIPEIVAHDSTLEKSRITKKQITFHGHCDYPQWSPNGREIGFYKGDKGINGLYTVGTGGGRESKIIIDSDKRKILPKFAWSPRGNRMAFVVRELNDNWDFVENLYVIRKNGSRLRPLLRQGSFDFEITNLKWSPNGDYIALEASHGREGLYADLIQGIVIVSVKSGDWWSPSQSGKTNWLIDWQNREQLLFLATYEEQQFSMNFAYEVWSCDPVSQKQTVLLEGPVVQNIESIEFWRNKGVVIYSEFDYEANRVSAIRTVDIVSRKVETVTESSMTESLSDRFLVSNLDRVYFVYAGELWESDWLGKATNLKVPLQSSDYTISPRGKKLCVQENSQLYTVNLAER
ncbi:MAG: SPOR domain-containing protein [bacterium]